VHDRLRRSHRVARSQLGLGQRQDHSTLDEFLRGLQTLQLLPQTRPHDPPTETRQRPWCSRRGRQLTLDVGHVRRGRVSAPLQPLPHPASRGDHAGHLARPALGELGLDVLEELIGDLHVDGADTRDRDAMNRRHRRWRRHGTQNHAHDPTVRLADKRHRPLGPDQGDRLIHAQPVSTARYAAGRLP
jgi:hypothetical protein